MQGMFGNCNYEQRKSYVNRRRNEITGWPAIYSRFITGTASALRCCLCKSFSCKIYSRFFCPDNIVHDFDTDSSKFYPQDRENYSFLAAGQCTYVFFAINILFMQDMFGNYWKIFICLRPVRGRKPVDSRFIRDLSAIRESIFLYSCWIVVRRLFVSVNPFLYETCLRIHV